MNVLNGHLKIADIIKHRKSDLQKEMDIKPLNVLQEEFETKYGRSNQTDGKNNFRRSLIHEDNVAVIYEFKPASPSMGDISEIKMEDALDVFTKAGASAVSILTEKRYFRGSMDNLKLACNMINLPVIRKDFIIDKYQIFQAKMANASGVLLMNGVYPDINEGISVCRELGIDPMVECKNREDIKQALNAGADILGINNRNFDNFTVNLKTTEKLAAFVPPEILLVSESGIRSPEDAKRLSSCGSDALLIGTSVMGINEKENMLKTATNIVEAVKGARVVRK